jgi:H+/gluconate symporter-like permease
MKAILILILIAVIAVLVATPLLTDLETKRQNAAAERVYAEARLEQARADTSLARADAFSQRSVVLLPWGLMIVAGAFVAVMIVLVVGQTMKQPTRSSDPTAYMPRPAGTRIDSIAGPVYMIQFPTESREQFMNRVATTEHMLDQRRRF